MAIISIKNLTFGYPGCNDNVFENVTLQLDSDWRLGLVGRNGTGKTTLLRLFAGEYEYSGQINSGGLALEKFPYELDDIGQTVRNVVAAIDCDYEEWKIVRELNILELYDEIWNRKYDSLSKGEQTKVMLAVLFNKANVFLLIDEPTNHLDMAGRAALSRYLMRKKAYIVISHDRSFLDKAVDHILSINRANIELRMGNYSGYITNKHMQDDYERRVNDKLASDIERLEAAATRSAGWADRVEATKFGGKLASGLSPDRGHLGAKSAKMMGRVKAMEGRIDKAIEGKKSLLNNIDHEARLEIFDSCYHSERLVSARDFVVKYGDHIVTEPLTFEIMQGDKVAICGDNGSGKSSIIKAITGEYRDYGGVMSVGSQMKISYVNQDTSLMSGKLDDYCAQYQVDKILLRSMLFKLGVDRLDIDKNIANYSEGQRKKLLIAQSLSERAHLYIWDEPLNYIDIITRQQILNLLSGNSITMLFVEHDKSFVDNIANKRIEL